MRATTQMRGRLAARALVLAAALTLSGGIRVSFSLSSSRRLVLLQRFGSSGGGGSAEIDIGVAPFACVDDILAPTPAQAGGSLCEMGALEKVYLALFSNAQWNNLTRSLENDVGSVAEARCRVPSMFRQQLSELEWRESAVRAPAAEADGVRLGFDVAAVGDGGSATDPRLRFQARMPLPSAPDHYALALFNCGRARIAVAGNATLLGAGGERLPATLHAVFQVRLALAVATAVAALVLAALCRVHRAVVVPLQWLLCAVLLLHATHQLILLAPIFAALRGELLPRGALVSTLDRLERLELAGDEWEASTSMAADAAALVGAVGFFIVLIAVASGRRFLAMSLPAREREVWTSALALFLIFGLLQSSCRAEVSCGIFVLSFQVVRILLIFGILMLLNGSTERLRLAHGHSWNQLRVDLPRLAGRRSLRWRLLLVYLVLPILFMFLEVQVLDWRAGWFKLLWREALDLYLIGLVTLRLRPCVATYVAHFLGVRPPANAAVAPGLYPRAFRWLLGSNVDAAAADAAVAAFHDGMDAAAQARRRRD